MVRQRLPAATRTMEWLYIIRLFSSRQKENAHHPGPVEDPRLTAKWTAPVSAAYQIHTQSTAASVVLTHGISVCATRADPYLPVIPIEAVPGVALRSEGTREFASRPGRCVRRDSYCFEPYVMFTEVVSPLAVATAVSDRFSSSFDATIMPPEPVSVFMFTFRPSSAALPR